MRTPSAETFPTPIPRSCAGYTLGIRSPARALLSSLLAVTTLVACSDDKDPNGPSAEPVLEVDPGECLLVTDALGAEVSKLPVVDCTTPHTHEIFATVAEDESEVYPGLSALETFAERECYGDFEGFVGISPFDSSLFITWMVPSLDGWNDEDDRTVLCILGRKDSGQLETSAKGLKV